MQRLDNVHDSLHIHFFIADKENSTKDLQEVMKKHSPSLSDALHSLDMIRHYDYDPTTKYWEIAKRHVCAFYKA